MFDRVELGEWATRLAWAPDGRLAIVGGGGVRDGASRPGVAWLRDIGGGVETLETSTEGLGAVAWSADGTRLAWGGRDGRVRLWRDGALEQPLSLDIYNILALAFSPAGLLAVGEHAIGASTIGIQIWDVDRRQRVAHLGHTETVPAVVWDGDDRVLGVGRVDDLRLHACTGELVWKRHVHPRSRVWVDTVAAARSPDGTSFAVAGSNGLIRIVRGDDGTPLGRQVSGIDDKQSLAAIVWTDRGIIAGGTERLYVVDPLKRRLERTIDVDGRVASLAWAPDGATLAIAAGTTVTAMSFA